MNPAIVCHWHQRHICLHTRSSNKNHQVYRRCEAITFLGRVGKRGKQQLTPVSDTLITAMT